MKTSSSFLIAILLSQVFSSCKTQSTSPESLDDIHLTFISGHIGANLMPSIPPDPIGCEIIFVAENSNQAKEFSNLSVLQADVFLNSTNQQLGSITFETIWDGKLAPAERDTVRLTKVTSPSSPFNPQCSKYVYLNLVFQNASKNSIVLKTDSLLFGCVY